MRWLPIPGFDQYEVSERGLVRKNGKLLKSRPNSKGYLRIGLHPGNKTRSIASLVMAAFVGPRPVGHHIAHLDGNKLNNRLDNLAYVTPVENERHKRLHGTACVGERHHWRRLTAEQVAYIRKAYKPYDTTFGFAGLARQFRVNRATVENAFHGRSWAALAQPKEGQADG